MQHDVEADTLGETAAELQLNLLLPAGTVTYPNVATIISNVCRSGWIRVCHWIRSDL